MLGIPPACIMTEWKHGMKYIYQTLCFVIITQHIWLFLEQNFLVFKYSGTPLNGHLDIPATF